MLIFVVVFYHLSLTFWLILSNVSHMLQRGNRSNSCMDLVGGVQQNVFHNIIPPVLGCICIPRLSNANRIGFSQYRQKAAMRPKRMFGYPKFCFNDVV